MNYENYYTDNDKRQRELSRQIIDNSKSEISKIIKVMNRNIDNIEIVKYCNMYLSDMINSIRCNDEIMERTENNAKSLYIKKICHTLKQASNE